MNSRRMAKRIAAAVVVAAGMTLLAPEAGDATSQGRFDSAKVGCNCHGPAAPVPGWPTTQLFVTGVPETGYVPGETYDLSVWVLGIALPAPSEIGFNLEASDGRLSTEDPGVQTVNETECEKLARQGCPVDSFCAPDSCDDEEIISIQATHDGPRDITAGSLSFSVRWQAPDPGTGDVVFWLAGNVVNGNGNPDSAPGPFLDFWNVMDPVTVSETE